MIIIISPAKIMQESKRHTPKRCPYFLEQTKAIYEQLCSYDVEQIQSIMKVSSDIAIQCVQRLKTMKFDMEGTCALDLYDGLQFKSMQLDNTGEKEWEYVCQHLRILSGFYGVLTPDDSIYPYRLEMQTPLSVEDCTQLYAFWMDSLAKHIMMERTDHIEPYIINLASKEYDRTIRPYILDDTLIDVVFYVRKNHKLKTMSTQAKKARGQMVRFMMEHHIEHLSDIKKFDCDGYRFDESLSDSTHLIFVKESVV